MGFRIRSYKFELRVLTLMALQTAGRKVAQPHGANKQFVLCKANLISLIDYFAFFKRVASTVPVWMEQYKRSENRLNFINRMTFKHKLNMSWIWGSHSGKYEEDGLVGRRFRGTYHHYLQFQRVSHGEKTSRIRLQAKLTFRPWWWRRYASPKHRVLLTTRRYNAQAVFWIISFSGNNSDLWLGIVVTCPWCSSVPPGKWRNSTSV
jgi:hypothetical protein